MQDEIETAGVVGGGTMGAGIATALLNAGLQVRLVERDAEAAGRARANVEALLDAGLARGRMSAGDHAARRARLVTGADYALMSDCALVIEAVFEDLGAKRTVFAALAAACAPEVILATNTSYLDPREIFADIPGPERQIGLHFFSPAHVMRLLEVVPLPATAPETLARALALGRRLGKVPVQAGICEGFIGNRMLKRYREMAERLVLHGADPHHVDKVLRAFGMAMGVFEVQDVAGLDIAAWQRRAARERGETPFAPIADRLVAMGRLGRKAGHGWYDHEQGNPQRTLPMPVAEAIDAARREVDLRHLHLSDDDIIDALMLTLVEEAIAILKEGIAASGEDIDLVQVNGYGFPRGKGGPVAWARATGPSGLSAKREALTGRVFDAPAGRDLRNWRP